MIASAAVQEDVDRHRPFHLSAPQHICPATHESLARKSMDDVTVLVAASFPARTFPALKQSGIAEIFLPGTSTQDIVDFIHKKHAAA